MTCIVYIIQMAEQKANLTKLFNNGLNHSYLGQMKINQQVVKQSSLQIASIIQESQITDEDFRINPNFIRPQNIPFVVFEKRSLVYMAKPPFFSCFSSRRPVELSLRNFILVAMQGLQIAFYLDFQLIECSLHEVDNGLMIYVQKGQKKFYFQLKNPHQPLAEWKSLLTEVIQKSKGKKEHYCYLPTCVQDYYKNIQVSSTDFEAQCNTGDILLFKSEHSAARVQRFFTNSEYDHVGLMLRNKKNQLYIFQSTSDSGVALTPWKHVVKYQWYKYALKIVWRKINLKLDKNDIQIIERFVLETLGSEFDVSLGKLFTFQSKLPGQEDKSKGSPKRKFFCSQLIAKLFKELGLLELVKSCTQYFPVNFSDKGKIDIVKPGIYFSKEMIIAFNQ